MSTLWQGPQHLHTRRQHQCVPASRPAPPLSACRTRNRLVIRRSSSLNMQQCDLLRALTTNALPGTFLPRAHQKHSWHSTACRHTALLRRMPLPGHVCFHAGAARPSGGKEMKRCEEAGLRQEEPKRKPESGRVSGTYWHCKDQRQQLPADII